MKESEAKEILQRLLPVVQKARSNHIELVAGTYAYDLTDAQFKMLEEIDPLLFGPKNVLPTLATLVHRTVAHGAPLEPGDFYNIMCAVGKIPVVKIGYILKTDGDKLPEPAEAWHWGWDSE